MVFKDRKSRRAEKSSNGKGKEWDKRWSPSKRHLVDNFQNDGFTSNSSQTYVLSQLRKEGYLLQAPHLLGRLPKSDLQRFYEYHKDIDHTIEESIQL